MLRSLWIFWIPIVFIWIQHIDIGQCHDYSDESGSNADVFNNNNGFYNSPDEFCRKLDDYFDGTTHFPPTFPPQYKIDNGWCNSNEYCIRFNLNMKNFLRGKLLVGSLNQLSQILAVVLSFHDQDGNIIQDDFGQPLLYTAIPQDLGHLLEISRFKYDYSYTKFIFKLLSDANFDPNSIFFHFARLTSMTDSNFSSANISGLSVVSIDFNPQIYTISMPCPWNWFCFWMLDNTSVSINASTSVTITFRPDQIGIHTLSYVAIVYGNYRTLCSYSISVGPLINTAVLLYPNTTQIYGLWDTTAGGNSDLSSPGNGPGNYNPVETPQNIFDNISTTKYTSFGNCSNNNTIISLSCGINTGFYIVLQSCPSLLIAFRFRTGNDVPARDPLIVTIEGSNRNSSLLSGSSWILIYKGSTGLDSDPGRQQFGSIQSLSNNLHWFKSYRILVSQKRGSSDAVQYADVELFGYYY